MTTWVLLRGLTREARHWGRFALELEQLLDGRDRVLALDLPGNGVFHEGTSPTTVPAMVHACRAELARQALQPPYVLVAMSLGAMVAVEWAHVAAADLHGCVVINTSLRGQSRFWQRLQPLNYPRLLALLRPGLTPLQRETHVLAMTSSAPGQHAHLPRHWADLADDRPVAPRNALRQLLAAARHVPSRSKPAVPMLVLASAGDRLVSHACSQRLASAWNLPLKLHPTAGHDLPLDAPQWVLQHILSWWKGLQGATSC